MATLTNKRRRELEALRMKMLRGEIRRIARKQGRTLSEAEVNEQVVNFEAFREKVKELESSGSYRARNTSVGGKKPTSASGAYQFVKGSVDPAYIRLKRLVGEIPEFEELLKHKDAAKADPVLQDMLFTADILQKNIQDKTGKKKPGEGDRLLVGVFAGNQQAGRDLYLRGHHTDFTNPNVISYANKGFGAVTAPYIATVSKQPFEYSPEERQAIANAYKIDPSGEFAKNVKKSIDAQKNTEVEGGALTQRGRDVVAEQYRRKLGEETPLTSQDGSIDAQKGLEIEKGALTERGRDVVEKQYRRGLGGGTLPTSEGKSIQGIQQVTPLNTTELETAQQQQVIPEEFSMQSGMQYGGKLPIVTPEQIARATEIEKGRREAVARKYRRGLGYASSELTGQRNPFAGGGMVYDYAGGGEVAARGLASLGRGPDTELVHMSPREVGALDDLARSTGLQGLPVNPQTGLPEAGIFDAILPIAVGAGAAALAPFTGGGSLAAALANPWVVGGTAALGAGIASGFDTAQMAKWGLGVGSGASMFGSLASAGSAAPAQELAKVPVTVGPATPAAEQAAREAAREAAVEQAKRVIADQPALAKSLSWTPESAAFEAITETPFKSNLIEGGALTPAGKDIVARHYGRGLAAQGAYTPSDALISATNVPPVDAQQAVLPGLDTKSFAESLYTRPPPSLVSASSTSPYAGLSPAEAGRLFRAQTYTGTLGEPLPSSPMFGDIARQKGMEQLSAAGRGITTPSGRQALFGSGIGKARQAGTLGFTPIAAGLGSMAASEYVDQPEFTPVEMPTTESYYPEGGYRMPPRKSVDPFRGERTVADRGEALYFDPEPYTAPGYVPNENTISREGIASTEIPTGFRGDVAGAFDEVAQRYREADRREEERRRRAQGLYYAREGGIVPYSNGGEVVDKGEATYFAPDRATTLPQAAATAASSPDVARMIHNANLWQNASNQGVHIRDWAHMSPAERGKYGDPYYGSGMERRKATGIEAVVPQGGVDPDIRELAYFSQGGLTQGPGDGMSDDIMLPITGTPDVAAVSPDEFVVPADVVSGLGNGSTSAGARQLYSMMDKVRDARTGKTAQPRAINPERMMPV